MVKNVVDGIVNTAAGRSKSFNDTPLVNVVSNNVQNGLQRIRCPDPQQLEKD